MLYKCFKERGVIYTFFYFLYFVNDNVIAIYNH